MAFSRIKNCTVRLTVTVPYTVYARTFFVFFFFYADVSLTDFIDRTRKWFLKVKSVFSFFAGLRLAFIEKIALCIFSQAQKLTIMFKFFKTKSNNYTRYNINKWKQSFSCNQSKTLKALRPLYTRKKITTSRIWNSNRMSYLTSEIHELIRSLVITDVFGTAQNPIRHPTWPLIGQKSYR